MCIAYLIADRFAATLDMNHLSSTQVLVLHAIKSVAMASWARATLANLRKGAM
jgi:hypothetical protein